MRAPPDPVDPRLVATITVAAAGFYLLLLCPEAYWGDSASFSSRLDTAPDPFTRSYWLFKRSALALTRFGIEPALAANATAALYGAVGVGAAAAVISRLGGGRAGAVVGAGSLGVAHTWWSMSEVAEVYTLYGALLLGLVALALGTTKRSAFLLGCVAGLSLNHHRMIFPAVAALLGFSWLRGPTQRRALLAGLGLGSLPWLALCAMHPPWSLQTRPGESPALLWLQRAFLGGRASAAEFLPPGSGALGSLARLLRFALLNFPGPALLLALPGIRWLWRRDRGAVLLLGVLAAAGGAMAFAMRWAGDPHVYLLGIYPVLAVLAGLGMGALWRHRRGLAGVTGGLAVVGPPALYAALAFSPAGAWLLPGPHVEERAELLWPGRRGWSAGSDWWGGLDPLLPEHAVVLPRWREGTVLEYRQEVLGLRADLRIELSQTRPYLLAEPTRPTYVTWTPPSREVPLDVARLDLLLQGEQEGLRRVVPREW